ncbi:hypothetical protein SAMN04488564_105567 [Lentzea waywayandensis]|uniref:DUF3800 domain-containing protein n=1 Tax=Lentzea waywayandensis TaxID=84724 RepID=A0A1I6EU98_9PSEU|nr:hypothetical protein [Lentzea waywayandensis]SFR21330.1 hypothetical protein SAMN04488564_105567 [Lentzea waywayandensis]
MTAHVFVDETKEKGYLVTAAALVPGDLAAARRTVRGLIMANQRRIHFHKESDQRRKQILDVVVEIAPEVTIYDGSAHARRRQRDACLVRLVADLAGSGVSMLVLEQDDSVLEADKKLLYRCVRDLGCHDTLVYRHHRAHEEPLLALPDAVAWCWHRGGHWKKRVEPLVASLEVL